MAPFIQRKPFKLKGRQLIRRTHLKLKRRGTYSAWVQWAHLNTAEEPILPEESITMNPLECIVKTTIWVQSGNDSNVEEPIWMQLRNLFHQKITLQTKPTWTQVHQNVQCNTEEPIWASEEWKCR